MNPKDAIIGKINNIKNDFVNGSTIIAIRALYILDDAAKIYPTKNDLTEMYEFADLLKSAKPSMAAMNNLVDEYMDLHKFNVEYNNDLNSLDILLKKIDNATITTINKAMSKVYTKSDRIKIMSCSYSSTFLKFLEESILLDYKPEILAVESRWGGHDFAHKLIEKAEKLDIKTTYVHITELKKKISKADCVLVGADSFNHELGALNGSPSLKVAKAAFEKIPFYIIAESFKQTDNIEESDGFDFIPQELISEIFTNDFFI